ncbi:hypothetical protein ACA910_003739 [Epithemia clementina (nom. ined.)]
MASKKVNFHTTERTTTPTTGTTARTPVTIRYYFSSSPAATKAQRSHTDASKSDGNTEHGVGSNTPPPPPGSRVDSTKNDTTRLLPPDKEFGRNTTKVAMATTNTMAQLHRATRRVVVRERTKTPTSPTDAADQEDGTKEPPGDASSP